MRTVAPSTVYEVVHPCRCNTIDTLQVYLDLTERTLCYRQMSFEVFIYYDASYH